MTNKRTRQRQNREQKKERQVSGRYSQVAGILAHVTALIGAVLGTIAYFDQRKDLGEEKAERVATSGREAEAMLQTATDLLGGGTFEKAPDDAGVDKETLQLVGKLVREAEALCPAVRVKCLCMKALVLHFQHKDGDALASVERAIEANPDYSPAYNYRGAILAALDRNDDALDSYGKAIALDENFPTAYSNRGILLLAMGRYDDAIVNFDKALALDESLAAALNQKGLALQALGRTKEALAAYDQAIDVKPRYAGAYHNRGVLLAQNGESEAALASFDLAIEFAQSALHHIARSNLLIEMHELDKAIESANRAVAIDPEYGMAYAVLGSALALSGRGEDAMPAYLKAVSIDPKDIFSWINYGNEAYNLELYEEALRAQLSALQLQPENGEIWYCRALSCRALNRDPEVLAALDSAIKYGTRDALPYLLKADIQLQQGDQAGAARTCGEGYQTHPECMEAYDKQIAILAQIRIE